MKLRQDIKEKVLRYMSQHLQKGRNKPSCYIQHVKEYLQTLYGIRPDDYESRALKDFLKYHIQKGLEEVT